MAQTLTLRLPEADAEEVRRIAQKERRSVSEVAARIVDEWLRTSHFPHIEFRSINNERVACLKGRLEIWQIVMVAQGYQNDITKISAHLNLRPEQVHAALSYYAAYPAEIDFTLAENQQGFNRLKRLLPTIEQVIVTDEDLASVQLSEEDL